MLSKIMFSVLVMVCCCTAVVKGQLCIPEPVETIDFSAASILSWSASENCPGTTYILVIKTGGVIEYEYSVAALSLNVSFLTVCRSYTFIVTPSADHILGTETSLQATLALPSDTVIAVQNFTGDQIDDDILIQWHVQDNYVYCIGYYHLLIWSEDYLEPDSLYVGQNGYFLEHVAQCMKYTFQVTPYYNSINGTTTEFNYTVPEETNFPTLVELRQDSLTINTTWSLEKFNVNRCNISALLVEGSHFNATYAIEDTPERPDVEVSISDLKANTMYYFNVVTNNTAGVSKPFQIAVQTLPIDPELD